MAMGEPRKGKRTWVSVVRRILTFSFALLVVLGGVHCTYIDSICVGTDEYRIPSFGLYGAFVAMHLIIQSFFAFLEHRKMRRVSQTCSYTKTVALTISVYQKEPAYLRECLESVKNIQYPPDKLKIIMVIDGNRKEDSYMMDMFKEMFEGEDVGTIVWENNYHSWDPEKAAESLSVMGMQEKYKHMAGIQWNSGDNQELGVIDEGFMEPIQQKGSQRSSDYENTSSVNQEVSEDFQETDLPIYDEIEIEDPTRQEVEHLIKTKRCVCIMQKQGGKREVMYTPLKALGDSVDYIQICNSNTKLDPLATVELVKVLESNEQYGAVGGDVRILNLSDSYFNFLSSMRYWITFNVERACQSYFNCVSCISGPLGLYRNDLLQQFLEYWYNQKFWGSHSTFEDDHHLTNHLLSIGYATKYTAQSNCYSQTHAQFLVWLKQQSRWIKSFFREWLYNAVWWHKHHFWMTYESVISGIFPFFIIATVIKLFFSCHLWDILWVLICIQLITTVKALYGSYL
ncbi:hyaluronan synthase 1-like [Ascaphus truei]|uniref:hyaluronan synthase 1-like n=1 Tax=Ascaphus truei TaxID=8439 RepID=UPI003F5AA9F3